MGGKNQMLLIWVGARSCLASRWLCILQSPQKPMKAPLVGHVSVALRYLLCGVPELFSLKPR